MGDSKVIWVPKMRLGDIVLFRVTHLQALPAIIMCIEQKDVTISIFDVPGAKVVRQGNEVHQFQYPAVLHFDEHGNPDYSKTDTPEHKDCPDYDNGNGMCDADGAACHVKGNVANCGEGHHA